MSGDYPLQYDDIGGMSSMTEGGTQDLSLDDGELLFDRLIPDLVSNNGAQGKDPLASGISHPSDNGTRIMAPKKAKDNKTNKT